ncbi:PHP domain-containing protein [Candidatus Woesearchaeota archaeon]|nr:PHP domain-containing protein [Candidatus Woesearchaeota archaeon]
MLRVDHEAPDLAALRKEGFVADMHFHTSYSHDCKTKVKDIITKARKLGIWVAFTDHNKIGGVIEARKYKDAPVIPGVELCSKEGKEVIAYFYKDAELERFFNKRIAPGLKDKNALRSSRTPYKMRDLMLWLDEERCIVHMPHPFAAQPRRAYLFFRRKKYRPLMEGFDSVEVFNGQVTRRANLSALGWAVQLGKGMAGGSDGHILKSLGNGVTASKASSMKGHLDNIRRGHVHVVGTEQKQHERALSYATGSVKVKIQKGVTGGLKKAVRLPKKALRL